MVESSGNSTRRPETRKSSGFWSSGPLVSGRGGRSKRGKLDRNFDARRGHSHRSNSVRGVGCEEQEKTWTVVWGTNPQEGYRDQSYPLTIGMEGATERRSKL